MGKRPHRAATRARTAKAGLTIRIIMPGLPITAPDPLAVSLGGSETAGLQLAAELARQGHQVTMICNCGAPFTWRGVRLLHGDLMAAECEKPCDLFVVQRVPRYLNLRGSAKLALLWMHGTLDRETAPQLMQYQHLADRIVTVSQWQADQFRSVAPALGADRFLVTRNGVDLDLVAEAFADAPERDPYRIVYTSRPERGLELLLKRVLPMVFEQEPRASLHLAFYDYPDPIAKPYYQSLREAAAHFGDRVVSHPPMPKRDLYRLMASSGVFVYPTPQPVCPIFAETSCITAMEAMACGLPWISTDRGALPETVGAGGVLVPLGDAPDASDPAVLERLVQEALRVMHDRAYAEELRAAGLERAASLRWEGVAKQLVAEATMIAGKPAARCAPRPRASVAIYTPCYDGKVSLHYLAALESTKDALARAHVEFSWGAVAHESLISRARNGLAQKFLTQTAATHLLFIDSDIVWEADDVLRLLSHGLDFVCGPYTFKGPGETIFCFGPLLDSNDRAIADPGSGCFEVEWSGTGFMLVARTVFEQLIAAYPERRFVHPGAQEPRLFYDFFPNGVENGCYYSEDIGFCKLWRSIGGRIWLDPAVKLTHHGMHAYEGDPMTMFAPAAAAAAA